MKTTSRLLCFVLVLLTAFSCTSLLSISAETYIVDKNFKLTRNANNEITVCGYEGSDTSIAVPSSLIGYDVKYIGDHAFYNETTLTDISLPNTLTGMGMGAFYGCSSLESISIPTQCINLGPHLFYGCSSLKNVTLSSVTVDIPRYCFSFCGSLEEITLPSTTKTIGEYAFANCSNLKSVHFDRYVESISPNAFQNSTHVVIYGYKNTYVETYAREQNIAFCALDQDIVTHQVIFYNYDGSVYYMTSVEEGKTAIMPIKPPTKPSTDTHYYVFKSWKGNIVNIQQTEHIYPVFTEYELVEKEDYFVIFLNGDGTILSSQTVGAGEDATPPAAPTKAESASTRYTFTGWDKSYTDIRSDMIISPVFSSQTKTFTVEFLNTDGTTLETFTVSYGESCPIPETTPEKAADDKYTYTFTGWDQDLSVITSDLNVSPVFEAKSTAAPVLPDTTNGTLKVDMVGGSGFTISIDDGASRPQGSVYVNRKIPVGVAVTVTATSSSNSEFIGWIDPATGKVLSTDYTYSFYTSGNDYLRAMYKTDSDGVNMVVFYHDKGNQYWDIQYYAPTDEISFPDGPMHAGFDFMGWDHTAEEIQAKLAAGEDVTVLPVWERQLVYVSITVN
ncbi:MAG: leucine-rich repeat protein, partial [Ruminococcus sp.]|nr:leucine-rich repeat protein [Ruminococcus sp.]